MIYKTKGIVLHSIKYSETSVITSIYTEEKGRQDFIVKNAFSKKSPIKATMLQSLNILELEADSKEKKQLQFIRECNLHYHYTEIPFIQKKTCVGLYLAELLYKSLKEADNKMFEFIENSLKYFDIVTLGSQNFHLFFMIRFIQLNGLEINNNYDACNNYFHSDTGKFGPSKLATPFKEEIFKKLSEILGSEREEIMQYELSNNERSELTDILNTYLESHLLGQGRVKSLAILREVLK